MIEMLKHRLKVSNKKTFLLTMATFFPFTILIDSFSFGYYIISCIVFVSIILIMLNKIVREYTIHYKSFVVITSLWLIIRFFSNQSDFDLPIITDERYFLFMSSLFLGGAVYWCLAEYIITDKFGKEKNESLPF